MYNPLTVFKQETVELTNLYVTNLDKALPSDAVRRKFARFGKISKFSLVNKDAFTTNIAFVNFSSGAHAKKCFDQVNQDPQLTTATVFWHKPKASQKEALINDIDAQMAKLTELNLKADLQFTT